MMKNFIKYSYPVLLILLITWFICCNRTLKVDTKNELPLNSRAIQLKLMDSLGVITFLVPLYYDTSFSWVHYSDCGKPCNEQKYRFQPKNLPITKESGWIWEDKLKDSIKRFTISHSGFFSFRQGDTAKNIIRHNHLKEGLAFNRFNPPIVFDTIQKINDRYYSIIVMEKSDTVHIKKIQAITTIKGNEIKFQYELLTKNNDSIAKNFVKNSIDLIKTIRIGQGL